MNIMADSRGGCGKDDKIGKRQRAIWPSGEIGINLMPYLKTETKHVLIEEGHLPIYPEQ